MVSSRNSEALSSPGLSSGRAVPFPDGSADCFPSYLPPPPVPLDLSSVLRSPSAGLSRGDLGHSEEMSHSSTLSVDICHRCSEVPFVHLGNLPNIINLLRGLRYPPPPSASVEGIFRVFSYQLFIPWIMFFCLFCLALLGYVLLGNSVLPIFTLLDPLC